jgi:hypothetical protein
LKDWSKKVKDAIEANNESLEGKTKEERAIALGRVQALEAQIKDKEQMMLGEFLLFYIALLD